MSPVRSLVVWVPDWPVVAYALESEEPPPADAPVAVIEKGAVVACSPAARDEGVRRGQRRRDAQARCPGLVVVDADAGRDHRAFAPVIARLEELAPGVQLRHPGLCVLRARGPARYYGGEPAAATVLAGAAAGEGVADVRVGVADGPFAAEQAARAGTTQGDPIRIVPPGATAAFLAPLSVAVLDDETVSLFARLGVQTLGQVAGLSRERLVERFGARGARLHALVTGADDRAITPRTPPPERHREEWFEPPLELAEQVAFGVRVAAEEFVSALAADRLVCTELRIVVTGARGERSERVWLHPGMFDPAAIVDRVRWQLAERGLRSGVERVRLEPEAVEEASHHAPVLFGSGGEERVHHALSRVQAMLGHRGVVTPVIGGGRWLAERQVLVPWGDRGPSATKGTADRSRPWPGSLPDPLPATVFSEPVPVAVVDGEGDMVAVDARGEPTATPAALVEGGVVRRIGQWAGPWPVVERMWDAARARRAHRFQVVDEGQTAWLLVCEDAVWRAEGRYD